VRADLMARPEHHRDRYERYERILKKRFPDGTASTVADVGNLLLLQLGSRHEQMVSEFCEEALDALSKLPGRGTVVPLEDEKREGPLSSPRTAAARHKAHACPRSEYFAFDPIAVTAISRTGRPTGAKEIAGKKCP
jgi:hypothetical protein